MRRIFTSILIIYSMVMLTACPKEQSIEKAKSSSAKLATYANTGVNITRDLFNEKVISLETKNKIADAFIVLADAGIAFDTAVKRIETVYGTDVPKAEVTKLFEVFDKEVVQAFLAVLETLKLVSDSSAYLVVIEAVRTAVLTIAEAFDRKKTVEAQVAR